MDEDAITQLAAYLAEALTTGNPLAPLPSDLTPLDLDEAETVAGAVLDRMGFVPCGLGLAPGPDGTMLAGPLLDTRMLADGATVALSALHRGVIRPAVLGILAEPLDPGADAAPVMVEIRAAMDIAATRLRDGPANADEAVADLAGLGLVVAAGRAVTGAAPLRLSGGAAGSRPRGIPLAANTVFTQAAAAARRLGGLPAGGLLLVVLGEEAGVPSDGQAWMARLGRSSIARARFF